MENFEGNLYETIFLLSSDTVCDLCTMARRAVRRHQFLEEEGIRGLLDDSDDDVVLDIDQEEEEEDDQEEEMEPDQVEEIVEDVVVNVFEGTPEVNNNFFSP